MDKWIFLDVVYNENKIAFSVMKTSTGEVKTKILGAKYLFNLIEEYGLDSNIIEEPGK